MLFSKPISEMFAELWETNRRERHTVPEENSEAFRSYWHTYQHMDRVYPKDHMLVHTCHGIQALYAHKAITQVDQQWLTTYFIVNEAKRKAADFIMFNGMLASLVTFLEEEVVPFDPEHN